MGIKERKEREREKQRDLILQAAEEIFTEEGLEKLSIRKIANRIEYSPAIIYHYFQDKEDIINHLMVRGYRKIISPLSTVQDSSEQSEKKLRELIHKYIETALEMPDEYLAVQLSKSPAILDHTSILYKGASAKNPALAILTECLKEIYQKNENMENDIIEFTAQTIVVSSFGLIIKLIIEKEIGDEQRKDLIDFYINWMIDGSKIGSKKE